MISVKQEQENHNHIQVLTRGTVGTHDKLSLAVSQKVIFQVRVLKCLVLNIPCTNLKIYQAISRISNKPISYYINKLNS